MFCYKCGHQLPDKAVFCNKCGAKLYKKEVKEQPDSSADVKEKALVTAPVETGSSAIANNTNGTDVKAAAKSSEDISLTMPNSVSAPQIEETVSQTVIEPVQEKTLQSKAPVEPVKKPTMQSGEDQENFIRYTDRYVKTNTGFNSALELLSSKPKANFAWLSYGIFAAVALIVSVILVFNGREIWTIPFFLALSVIPGYLAAYISGGIILKIKLINKNAVKFKGQVDEEKLKTFLNSHLSYLSPYFDKWGDMKMVGGGIVGASRAALVNAVANASQEINIGSVFGADRKLITKIGVRPDLNGDPEYSICTFSSDSVRSGSHFISSYKCLKKTAPILQAAMEYYFLQKSGNMNDISDYTYAGQNSDNTQYATQNAERGNYVPYTKNAEANAEQICASERKSTFLKRFFAIAGVLAVIATVIIIVIINAPKLGISDEKETAKTTAAEHSYAPSTGKDDSLDGNISHITPSNSENYYTVENLKNYIGCESEEIVDIFGELEDGHVSSYGGNNNLLYYYDELSFFFVRNYLSEIIVNTPEKFMQKGETLDKTGDEIVALLGKPVEYTPYYSDETNVYITSYDMKYITNGMSLNLYVNCDTQKVSSITLKPYYVHQMGELASFLGKPIDEVLKNIPGAEDARFDSLLYETRVRYDYMQLYFDTHSSDVLTSITDLSPDRVIFLNETLDKSRRELINLLGEPIEEFETADNHKMVYNIEYMKASFTIIMPNASSKAESITINLMPSDDSDVIIIGGAEYPAESAEITGTPFNSSQLVNYIIEGRYCPEKLTDLLLSINHPELIDLYEQAYGICETASIAGSSITLGNGATFDLPSCNTYGETGCTFESYRSLIFDTFTEKIANEILESEYIASFGGELWHTTGGIGGGYISKFEYIIKSQTDSEIEIQEVTYSEFGDINTHDLKFILTNEGWRVDEFSTWFFGN